MMVTDQAAAGPLVRWPALRSADPEALERVAAEARELARALAVESLAADADADLGELAERRRHLGEAAWPEDPLTGFELQSSLGAYVVARVAMAWVPSGQMGLRKRPHAPEGLLRALTQQGVAPLVARSVVGDWPGAPEDFDGELAGLDAGRLAGLAERSLTAAERDLALAQVACSPRDLARLAATLTLGRAVRRLLPLLADEGLGAEFTAGLALIASDRAARVRDLLPEAPANLRERTLAELAEALVALSEDRRPELSFDPWAPELTASTLEAPPEDDAAALDADASRDAGPTISALSASDDGEADADGAVDASDAVEHEEAELDADGDPFGATPTPVDGGAEADDEEDVLEIVEERVDPASLPEPGAAWRAQGAPALPAAWPRAAPAEAAWAGLRPFRALVRERGALLGLAPAPEDPRGGPVPADARLLDAEDGLTERIDLEGLATAPRVEGSPAEPFLPPVRSALRAALAAADGAPVPSAADAGGLGWFFARAAALSACARGELEAGLAALEGLPDAEAPERRWIRDRKMRYEGRRAEPLATREARGAAAALLLDLARSLARTLTLGPGAPADSSRDPD